MSDLSESGSKLIGLLSDGELHSCEDIAQLLNVANSSVNNYIKGLQEIGLDIDTEQGGAINAQHHFHYLIKIR